MTKKVAIFVANGTEPIEALGTADVLRRGGVDVDLVSSMMGTEVSMAHKVLTNADLLESQFNPDTYDVIVVPGGSVGVENLAKSGILADALRKFMGEGRNVAAICAGPTILNGLGLLEGRKATCYPGCQTGWPDGVYQDVRGVVVDRNLVTASGPGQALEFGIAVLRLIMGDEIADSVKSGMLA